jgi:hypothetical protein
MIVEANDEFIGEYVREVLNKTPDVIVETIRMLEAAADEVSYLRTRKEAFLNRL